MDVTVGFETDLLGVEVVSVALVGVKFSVEAAGDGGISRRSEGRGGGEGEMDELAVSAPSAENDCLGFGFGNGMGAAVMISREEV